MLNRRVKLEDIASPPPYALATGPFGSAISSRHFKESGIPVIRGTNLSESIGQFLVEDEYVYLEPQKAEEFKRSIVRAGDLVFTCWGTVGQIGLIRKRSRYPEYVISNKQMKLTPNPAMVDSLFLYYCLSSSENIEQVKGNAI